MGTAPRSRMTIATQSRSSPRWLRAIFTIRSSGLRPSCLRAAPSWSTILIEASAVAGGDTDERKVREMCYTWVRKHPDHAFLLPEDLRKAFEAHVADGCQDIKFVYRRGTGWHVRGYTKSDPKNEHKQVGAESPFGGWVNPLDWSIKGLLPR